MWHVGTEQEPAYHTDEVCSPWRSPLKECFPRKNPNISRGAGEHASLLSVNQRYPLIERPPDVGDPLIHVYVAAGEAEAALAAEGHPFLFQAVRAQIRGITRFHGATAEHVV